MELIMQTLKSLSLVIVDPTLALILVMLALIFYIRNRKIATMQKMIAGESINSPLELTVSQICFGLIGGIIGSIALTILGVVFDKSSGVQFIFLVSLMLMIIKPRFICFSYSGALLGFVSLIYTYIYPNSGLLNINIVALMTLVGVLHIVEGLLVIVDGSRGSIPVFTKKDNKILGGYAMRRYWLIPVALFIAVGVTDSSAGISVQTPSWWSIIGDHSGALLGATLMSMPFMGMLSYSSVTFTRNRREKVVSSGIWIMWYGIALTLISRLANFGLAGKIIVLILAPLGHELMIRYQKKIEVNKEPIFFSEQGRIKVLEVVPDTISYESGIKVNDDILKVNGTYVNSEKEIYLLSRKEYGSAELEIRRGTKNLKIIIKFQKDKRLGLVLVPILVNEESKIDIESQSFRDLLHKIKEKQAELGVQDKQKDSKKEQPKEITEAEKAEDIKNMIETIKEIETIENEENKK